MTTELIEELRACLRHYTTIHEVHEAARFNHTSLEAQVAEIRRAYTERLYRDIADDPSLKVQFSNQERRDIEVQRRLERDIAELLQQEANAKQHRTESGAELERSAEALKTMRALAGLVEAERRMEAVMTDVASMPRINVGRR